MKGKFIISLDTELAWGTFDLPEGEQYEEHFQNTRYVIDELLKLFEKYNVSATWAIVGHLFLDSCEVIDGEIHEVIVRPEYERLEEDWFFKDPGSNIEDAPFWYGKDIVEKIKVSYPKQEIGSHSFSHIIFGEDGCSYEAAESDIRKASKVAKQNDIKMKSFVFPRNSIDYLDILKEYGYKTYRGYTKRWYEYFPESFVRILHYMDNLFAITPPTVRIKEEDGIYNVSDSMFYMPLDGIRSLIPMSQRIRKAKKGIDLAIKKQEIFHLWFHPFNLGVGSEKLLAGMEEILRYADEKQRAGELKVVNMNEAVKRYQAKQAKKVEDTLDIEKAN